ncbi:MAG: hypothetical protein RIB78_09125 [Gammaproteobacteria bacterium]
MLRISCILCLVFILAACTKQPNIYSSTEQRVEINSFPKDFLWSFELAMRECEQHERVASYVPDSSGDLKMLVFDCVDPEALLTEETAESTGIVSDEAETENP